eukprot:g4267.t1
MADAMVVRNESTPTRETRSKTSSYWCHVCSKETDVVEREDEELECVICKGNFVEECVGRDDEDQENHPSNFVVPSSPPFRSQNTSNQIPPISLSSDGHTRQSGHNNMMHELVDQVLRGIGMGGANTIVQTRNFALGDYAFGDMDSILNQLLQVEGRAKPRTSQEFIKNLKEIEISDASSEDCAVCKECFEKKQIAHRLPCGHMYHRDCILPWIQKHNTCPVCRHVLPSEQQNSSTTSSTTTSTNRSSPAPSSSSSSDVTVSSLDATAAEELDNMLASPSEDEEEEVECGDIVVPASEGPDFDDEVE